MKIAAMRWGWKPRNGSFRIPPTTTMRETMLTPGCFPTRSLTGFAGCARNTSGTKGLLRKKNPYRSTIEQTIRENFRFDSYSYGYDWRLSLAERGRKCILLFTGEEFYSHEAVPEGLLEIRYTLLSLNQKLEAELNQETRIISLPLVTAAQWKEAA